MSADLGRKPLFSIIYVNYRSARALSFSLRSLRSFTKDIPVEIIVVNNDAPERALLEQLSQYHSLTLLHSKNIGFAAAANLGVKVARGDILFFLNPDTKLLSGDFSRVAELFSKEKNIGVLGAMLVSEKGSEERESFGKQASLCRSISAKIPFFRTLNTGSIEWVSGGALFTPKELFEILRGFDERFFLYFEDMEYCLRAAHFGKQVARADFFRIAHQGGTSFKKRSEQKARYYESQERFYRKNGHRLSALIFSLVRKMYV